MATRSRRSSPIFDYELPIEPHEALDVATGVSRGAEVARDRGLIEWASLVPESHGALDFDRFKFQRDLYADAFARDREGVIKKATQLGISAWALRWSLYWSDVWGKTGLYVMPSEKVLADFSDHRIRTTIRRSPYLQSRMDADSINNRGMRQVGLGFVYFRGSTEATNLESIPADNLVLDEYDSLVQANVAVAESRVTGPLSDGLIRRVGVPSVPGFGISKLYEQTTQHVWMVKCAACGEHQPIVGVQTFQDNLDVETARLLCKSCRRGLDVLRGEWVATFPERETRGYWITKFIVPGMDLRRVVTNSRKTLPADRQSFFNRDLGEEYAPSEGRLSREALMACTRPGQLHLERGSATMRPVTMGVDVASARAFNVRISEHLDDYVKRALWIGTLEWQDVGTAAEQMAAVQRALGALMVDYNVNMAAIDHLPENRLSKSFAAQFPGRVYLIAYDTAPKPKAEITRVDDAEMLCVVHRTTAIDATLDGFRQQRNLLPDLDELPPEYPEHLGNLIRVFERDEYDKVRQFYRSTGPDDFAQAEVYDLMAGELMYRRVGQEALAEEINAIQASRDPEQAWQGDPLSDGERLEEPGNDDWRDWQ